jgi:EAL domain-containing protein (putative c-di-GMP-specific phosphodiesterase class I)/GGDEF domain-containing protein
MPTAIAALKRERDRFVAFAFASADILIELEPNSDRIVYANGAILGFLDKTPEELQGTSFFELVDEGDRDKCKDLLLILRKIQRVDKEGFSLVGRNGAPLQVTMSGFHLGNVRDNIFLSISVHRDNENAVAAIFRRDLYSGLLKKDIFIEYANEKIREAVAAGENVQITLLDFPELKAMLDSLPADVATALMSEISEYLREQSVDGDMAGIIGEGAYSVVHHHALNTQKIVDDIVTMTQRADPEGKGVSARASTIDAKPEHLTPTDSANALLYTINKFASTQGKEFSLESLASGYQEMLQETVVRITEFKQVVQAEKFDIAYQPIVDLKNAIIHHYESLVRLKDGSQFTNPYDFITFGEQSGTIIEFDLSMLQRVIETLHLAAKKNNMPLVAVNLSGRSLSSSLFMDAVEKLLVQAGRRRPQVILEVTESAKIDDIHSANKFIQSLRAAGNRVCLDDFGAGESSFDYLRNLHVDFVKIDGSYVKESLLTMRGREMLKAMSALCKDLGMVTIGEFVEDERAAKLLWECGVKFGQGYYLGKPDMDAEVLANCSKPTPFYGGIMHVRDFSDRNKNKKWWARKE